MANVFQAFNYEISDLSFMGESINPNYIKYIIIESLYESRTVATMYLSMHIPSDLYQSIVNAEKTNDGKLNIVIRARNMYSDTSIANDYVSGRFTYIIPSSNPDYSLDLSNSSTDNYKSIVMSLINTEVLDELKSSLTGSYNKIDVQDLLRIALQHFKNVVVQMPTVEGLKPIENIVIPPMNSMKKLVDYIFNVKPFYNTAYTFFVAFNRMYLCAHDNETTASIGSVSTVVFHVVDITDTSAYFQGMSTGSNVRGNYVEDGIYHIYINPGDIALTPNKGLDMISDQIMSVEEGGKVTEPIKLNYGVLGQSTEHEFAKLAVRRGSNVDIYANTLNSNTVLLEIKKAHLNGAIITPDKIIKVNFELTNDKQDFNAKYSGDYYIAYKQEVIRNSSGTFVVAATIGLKKIGNLKSVADTSEITSKATGEGSRGYASYSLKSSNNQSAKSAVNKSKTQSTTSRVSGSGGRYSVSAPNPYNLKSNKYAGPEYINTASSGAVHTYEPHIEERKI